MGNLCLTAPDPPPNPDFVDLSHFELMKVVGKGGFGKVNAIQRKSDHALKALKRMSKCQVVKKDSHIRMVWVERNIMAKLDSPFLVGLEHAFQNDRELFFVMPFMQGGDLRYHLNQKGVMTEDECRFYAAEMILGLEAMHRLRIVYRDFKPDNLLLDSEGHLRISDFGLSVQLQEKHHFKMKGNAGTSGYLAPEVCAGDYYGTAPDVWSFGVTVYELLHGRRPYHQSRPDRDHISRIAFGVTISSEAKHFIKGLLTIDPRHRLGCGQHGWEEVKRHKWLRGITWADVASKKLKPPIQPDLDVANCSNQADLADQLIDKKPEPIPQELQKHFVGFDWNIEIKKKNSGDGMEERKVREVAAESKIAAVTEEDPPNSDFNRPYTSQPIHVQSHRISTHDYHHQRASSQLASQQLTTPLTHPASQPQTSPQTSPQASPKTTPRTQPQTSPKPQPRQQQPQAQRQLAAATIITGSNSAVDMNLKFRSSSSPHAPSSHVDFQSQPRLPTINATAPFTLPATVPTPIPGSSSNPPASQSSSRTAASSPAALKTHHRSKSKKNSVVPVMLTDEASESTTTPLPVPISGPLPLPPPSLPVSSLSSISSVPSPMVPVSSLTHVDSSGPFHDLSKHLSQSEVDGNRAIGNGTVSARNGTVWNMNMMATAAAALGTNEKLPMMIDRDFTAPLNNTNAITISTTTIQSSGKRSPAHSDNAAIPSDSSQSSPFPVSNPNVPCFTDLGKNSSLYEVKEITSDLDSSSRPHPMNIPLPLSDPILANTGPDSIHSTSRRGRTSARQPHSNVGGGPAVQEEKLSPAASNSDFPGGNSDSSSRPGSGGGKVTVILKTPSLSKIHKNSRIVMP